MPRAGTTPPEISAAARRRRLAIEKAALEDYYANGGKISIRAIAARHPGVNRTTLSRRINGTHKPADVAFQHLQRLNPEQESAITARVEALIEEGNAPDLVALTKLANEELQRGIDASDPAALEQMQAAGELGQCWGRNFLKRHPDLEVKRKLHSFHKAEATAVQKAMGELAKAYYAEKKRAFEEKKQAQAVLKSMDRVDHGYEEAQRRLHLAKQRHLQACKEVNDFVAAQGLEEEEETTFEGFADQMHDASRTDPALAMQGIIRF
ncbi:hypothetical protein BDZ85DRAFT_8343 [Elsinoe ampelina]|uniref:Uncharacterized protein n=1 Tax=Elsinoe ampelina TaxID=302913 RepID=A0A6A6GQI8_9PEZI|nr:hypothetical protein BDZ85DRAFT_8343 [Elsinoe ampelina]